MGIVEDVQRESKEWKPPRTNWGFGDLPIVDQFRNCSYDDILAWLIETAEEESSPTLAAAAVVLGEKFDELDELLESWRQALDEQSAG